MADNRTSELDGLLDSGRLRIAAQGCKSEADLARVVESEMPTCKRCSAAVKEQHVPA